MAYKKYIKRGNKRYGPYYYESYRDKKGIARTRYVSDPRKTSKRRAVTPKKPYFLSIKNNLVLLFSISDTTGIFYYNINVSKQYPNY